MTIDLNEYWSKEAAVLVKLHEEQKQSFLDISKALDWRRDPGRLRQIYRKAKRDAANLGEWVLNWSVRCRRIFAEQNLKTEAELLSWLKDGSYLDAPGFGRKSRLEAMEKTGVRLDLNRPPQPKKKPLPIGVYHCPYCCDGTLGRGGKYQTLLVDAPSA